MIKGKPRLATWNAGTLSLFEMDSSDVFQQLATAAVANVGSYLPGLAFSRSGNYLLVGGNRVAATFSEASFDAALAQIGLLGVSLSSTGPTRLMSKNYQYGLHMVNAQTGAFVHSASEIDGSIIQDVRTGTMDGVTQVKRAFTKDGQTVVSLYNATPFVRVNTATSTLDTGTVNERPNYTTNNVAQTAFNIACVEVSSSYDNTLLFFGAANGTVHVCPFTPNNAATSVSAAIQTLTGTGAVHRIAASPDDKFLAVTRLNAGVYTTTIYTRAGNAFTQLTTIAAFGQELAWTGDGFYLIDGILKKARHYTGTFDVADAIMANLPATVSVAALSQHVDGVAGVTRLYYAGSQDIAQGITNLATLKVALLSNLATYDANDGSFADVTNSGAYQVSGGGWTAGGILLTGVTKADGPLGTTVVTAANVSQAISAPLTFHYALIYDSTTNIPLALIDYLEDVAVPALSTLNIDFTSGVLTFVPV